MSSPREDDKKWITVGRLWANPRDMSKLSGTIIIKDLGIEMKVYAQIKTKHQKTRKGEEDIRISALVPNIEEEESPF